MEKLKYLKPGNIKLELSESGSILYSITQHEPYYLHVCVEESNSTYGLYVNFNGDPVDYLAVSSISGGFRIANQIIGDCIKAIS